ncbi:hypothetical protein BJ508DRAFT_413615 [Ascobolus immersus RN42]|uniref:Uncharacterized protein n=1 Tax=Ascobolus immersus RN42 TaxID=1160509 RepID=A0A3N4INN7_ASCIM|nr:hypothetical protein BJ508DRAFT_413615 [Ascobolus immersus RN42]
MSANNSNNSNNNEGNDGTNSGSSSTQNRGVQPFSNDHATLANYYNPNDPLFGNVAESHKSNEAMNHLSNNSALGAVLGGYADPAILARETKYAPESRRESSSANLKSPEEAIASMERQYYELYKTKNFSDEEARRKAAEMVRGSLSDIARNEESRKRTSEQYDSLRR